MPFPEQQVAWFLANRAKILRYAFVPQLLIAVVFLGFAYKAGKDHAHLLLAGARTQGTVVGFKPVLFRSNNNSFSRTVDMPIIQFRAGDHVAQFQEWKSSNSDPSLHARVPVLYDPSDTTIAMMDRGALNWLPWAPCAAIGAFLALVSLKGLFAFLAFAAPASNVAGGAPK
jgi:hypothetical protein